MNRDDLFNQYYSAALIGVLSNTANARNHPHLNVRIAYDHAQAALALLFPPEDREPPPAAEPPPEPPKQETALAQGNQNHRHDVNVTLPPELAHLARRKTR